MKKIFILVFMLFSVSFVSAFWEKKPPVKTGKKAFITLPKDPRSKTVDSTPQAVLSSKNWLVYLKIIGSDDVNVDTDILNFSGGLFSSKNLANKGFNAVSYSAKKTVDGAIQWEVMQESGDLSVAFWKAELKDDVLRGIFCVHAKGAGVIDYEFSIVVPDKGKGIANE